MHRAHVCTLLDLATDCSLATRFTSDTISQLFIVFCDRPRLAVT